MPSSAKQLSGIATQRQLGNLALLAVALAWGTMVPVITYLSGSWDPFFLAAVRYLGGVPLLYMALWAREGFARPEARPPIYAVLATGWLGIAGFAFLYTAGVAFSNPVIAAVLGAANPVIAAVVGSLIFKIRFDRGLVPAILLAVIGCGLATLDWTKGAIELEVRGGEILVLIASACWAWYSVAVQRWLRGWSQMRVAAHTMSAAAIPLFFGYLIAREAGWAAAEVSPIAGWDLAIFVWMILGSVVIGLLLWNFGVSRTGIVVASLYLNLSPVVAVGILAITGHPPTTLQMLGGALVIGGVAWSEWRAIRKVREAS